MSKTTAEQTFEALSHVSLNSVSFANNDRLAAKNQSLLLLSLQLSKLPRQFHFQICSDERLEHYLAVVPQVQDSQLENVSFLVFKVVSSFRGRIPCCILFISSFKPSFTLPLCIFSANFLEIWSMGLALYTYFKFLWIVRLPCNKSNKFPDCQSFIQRSSAFNVLSFEGFWRERLGIIMIAFISEANHYSKHREVLMSRLCIVYRLWMLEVKTSFSFCKQLLFVDKKHIFFKFFVTIPSPLVLYIIAFVGYRCN